MMTPLFTYLLDERCVHCLDLRELVASRLPFFAGSDPVLRHRSPPGCSSSSLSGAPVASRRPVLEAPCSCLDRRAVRNSSPSGVSRVLRVERAHVEIADHGTIAA